MLNPYEEQEAWEEYQAREDMLDFQSLITAYRYELMQVPEAEGLREFLLQQPQVCVMGNKEDE